MTKVAFQMYSTIFVCSSIEMHGRKGEQREGGGCCWEWGCDAGSGGGGVEGLHWGLWGGTSAQLLN